MSQTRNQDEKALCLVPKQYCLNDSSLCRKILGKSIGFVRLIPSSPNSRYLRSRFIPTRACLEDLSEPDDLDCGVGSISVVASIYFMSLV